MHFSNILKTEFLIAAQETYEPSRTRQKAYIVQSIFIYIYVYCIYNIKKHYLMVLILDGSSERVKVK